MSYETVEVKNIKSVSDFFHSWLVLPLIFLLYGLFAWYMESPADAANRRNGTRDSDIQMQGYNETVEMNNLHKRTYGEEMSKKDQDAYRAQVEWEARQKQTK